jgi:glycosyl transferase family 25
MFERFEKATVINLPERQDRRRDTVAELERVGAKHVEFFSAIRPSHRGPFRSLGEHGCFLSHLGVLASSREARSLLVMEDDVVFTSSFSTRSQIVATLPDDWDVFYAGHYQLPELKVTWAQDGLVEVDGSVEFIGAHCYGVNGPAIAKLLAFCESTLASKQDCDHCMPFDGAINIARRELGLRTFAAIPPLAYQRPSRTDIADLRWFDRVKFLAPIIYALRKAKGRMEIRA